MSREQKFFLSIIVIIFILFAGRLIYKRIDLSRTTFIAGSRSMTEVEEQKEPRLPPLRLTDPVRGSADEKAVQIVEFADYTCFYCRLVEKEIQSLMSDTSLAIRLVWRDLPIDSKNTDALLSAQAGRCANEQKKFWEMHDALMESESFDAQSLVRIGARLNLNQDRFSACLSSQKYLSLIEQDISIAKKYDLNGTPTFFINGKAYTGYITVDEFRQILK